MQRIELGKTGIEVSRLGLGTVKLGRNTGVKYPNGFELPDDATAANLLAYAQDLGINLLDTAPAYGVSEQRLGQLLQGQRDQWVIVSKAGEEFDGQQSHYVFTPEHIIQSVERSLQRLCTDYIDIMLIHSDGEDMRIIEEEGVFDTLSQLKTRGLIRSYGMSTKTVEGGLATLAAADIAMVTCHPGYDAEVPVIEAAHAEQKGILIKKAFASGHLDKLGDEPVETAMRYVFSHAGVSSVIAGTINPKHLEENVRAVEDALTE